MLRTLYLLIIVFIPFTAIADLCGDWLSTENTAPIEASLLEDCKNCKFRALWNKNADTHAQNHFLHPQQRLEDKLRITTRGKNISTTVFPSTITFNDVFQKIANKEWHALRPQLKLEKHLQQYGWQKVETLETAAIEVELDLGGEHYEVRVVACVQDSCEIEKGIFVGHEDLVTIYPLCGPGVWSIRFSEKRQKLLKKEKRCSPSTLLEESDLKSTPKQNRREKAVAHFQNRSPM